jgi:prepilin-type N-terminal cleavage/methylation domain-containing protein
MKEGFTLAELLIALAILGVIATFTIPKVLQSQADGKYNAIAKEAAGFVYAAYGQATLQGFNQNLQTRQLTPYLNYVKFDTTSVIDSHYGSGTRPCDNNQPCILLHNGARVQLTQNYFNGTANTNAIWFRVDPDGKETVTGSTTSPGKSVNFFIYANGRLTTGGGCLTGTTYDAGVVPCGSGDDPPWFSWN